MHGFLAQRGRSSARSILVLMLLILPTALQAAERSCTLDPESGMPVPTVTPGICIDDAHGAIRLVQSTADGLTIIVPDPDAGLQIEPEQNGRVLLRVPNATSLIVHCPETESGTPPGSSVPACVSDFGPLLPGPSAHVGFGTVQASALFDRSERAAVCPSALHILGTVRGPGGQPFDLRGALVFTDRSPNPDLSDDWSLSSGPGTCGAAISEISLSSVHRPMASGTASAAGPGSEVDPMGFASRMTARDWEILQRLVRLDDDELEILSMSGPETTASGGSAAPTLQEILDAVNSAATKAQEAADSAADAALNAAQAKSETLLVKARIPDAPALRNTFQKVRVGDLIDLLDLVNEEIQGLIGTAKFLRGGFKSWESGPAGPCESGSGCFEFKEDLGTFLSDLEAVDALIQATACLDGPTNEDRSLDTGFIQDFIDQAPPVVLFVLESILDRLAGDMSGKAGFESNVGSWRTMFGDFLAAVPQDFQQKLQDACDPAKASNPLPQLGGDPVDCFILRPPESELALSAATPVGKVIAFLTRALKEHYTPDDAELTVEGVAAAGGGAGTNVPNAVKIVINVAAWIGEKLGSDKAESIIEDLKDRRGQCLDMDEEIEEDIRGCEPRMNMLVVERIPIFPPRPSFKQVVDHVEREIFKVEQCQIAGACVDADPVLASDYVDNAVANSNTLLGFRYLCDAWCVLIGDLPCRNAVPEPVNPTFPELCFNGVDDDNDGLVDCDDPDCNGTSPCTAP